MRIEEKSICIFRIACLKKILIYSTFTDYVCKICISNFVHQKIAFSFEIKTKDEAQKREERKMDHAYTWPKLK